MNDDIAHSALTRWLSSTTGKLFIQAYQSVERPALPYGEVRFLGSAAVRQNVQDFDWTDVDGQASVAPIIEVEWRFSVHFYTEDGERPSDVLQIVRSAAEVDQIREPLIPQLTLHQLSQVRNIPEWIDESWEPRAQMDIMLRGLTRNKFDVDVIEEYTFDFERT